MKPALLRRHNSPKALLVISTYPAHHTIHTGGGLASYTKNTLLSIKKSSPTQKIIVLANVIDSPEIYLEKDILIVRCWERGFFRLYPALLQNIFRFYRVKNILFGFEFSAFGDVFSTAFLPAFLGLLRLLGKKTVSVIHQVTAHLTDLSVHTGLSRQPGSLPFYKFALNLYFKLLGFTSFKIVTLENELSERFNQIVPGHKAITIPHGLYPHKPLDRAEALTHLNLDQNNFYVLSFGYLSHYKGSDLLVKAFQKPLTVKGKKVCLILAGSESPTQGQKHHYQHFYQKLYSLIEDNPNIIHTGFVPDKRIKTLFSAANLVVFPYRAFMSASGPLSLAIAYRKPFLVSEKLKNYSTATFENNVSAIRAALKQTLASQIKLNRLVKHSQKMSLERDFRAQGPRYLSLFH